MSENIQINRAPVLTLWAAVVAERLGYDNEEALTLAKAVSGLNAQSKGRRLGIFEEKPSEDKPEKQRQRKGEDVFSVELLGRPVPAVSTPEGVRAVDDGKPISPASVQKYLENKFGDALPQARKAMQELAGSFDPAELKRTGFSLYEEFRPSIPEGKKGWGAKGELSLDAIHKLSKSK